jgi:hypothetical protein
MDLATSADLNTLIRAVIKNECRPVDIKARFVDYLDDSWGDDSFLQQFHLTASRVIEECDPTMFNQELLNFTDSCDDLIEIDGQYYDRDAVESVKADLIQEIESI